MQGPHSSLHHDLPTTCFLEVIVVPLATWIYLVLGVVALPILFSRRRHGSVGSKHGESAISPAGRTRPSLIRRILSILYYFFIVALIAMVSLQIARLATAMLGVGLLPFTYAGVLLALATHILFDSKLARGLNMLYWIMLLTTMALLVAALADEGSDSRNGIYPIDQYKVSDEIIDVAVMIGVAAVLCLLEIVAR